MIEELTTSLTSFELYTIFKDDDHSFILDSAMDAEKLGRYSFISANPFKILKYDKQIADPLEELREELKSYKVENNTELPFIGGAVGYLAYDLSAQIENLPETAIADVKVPDLYLGLYNWVIVVDHLENKKYIATPNLDQEQELKLIKEVKARINLAEEKGVASSNENNDYPEVELKSNFTRNEYLEAIKKIQDYIQAGDIYQANLAQRFSGKTSMSSYELYSRLRRVSPAPFGSFLNFSDVDIISNSPERFIKVRNRIVETRPIKGTRPRGSCPKEDQQLKEELLNSAKDRAELLMIVDLERNDLGKIARVGTVKVPELFELEEYANVHHLVATVKAEMSSDKDIVDLIEGVFPGGSITGAPKIRAMEIIDELEPTKRNVYTGSIGYIGFDGSVDLNIAIRTVVKKDEQVCFQVGGGITWDSDPVAEYQETLDKADSIIKALRGYYAE
ncbi:aminodeoxychorismate synthase component I [Halanaerocella petrolearia]